VEMIIVHHRAARGEGGGLALGAHRANVSRSVFPPGVGVGGTPDLRSEEAPEHQKMGLPLLPGLR
jgi:hypothetical protein